MITEAELKCLKCFLRFLCRFGIVDLDFKEKNERPLVQAKSKWKRIFLIVRTVFSFLYVCFSVLRIPSALEKFHSTKRMDGFVIHAIVIVYRAGLCVAHMTVISHINGIADLVNDTLSLNSKLGFRYFKSEFLVPNLREKILLISVWVFCAAEFLVICVYMIEYDSPVYVLSVLPFKMRRNYVIYFCGLVLEIFTLFDISMLVNTFILIEFVFIFSANFWLKYLCSGRLILEETKTAADEMNEEIMETTNIGSDTNEEEKITELKNTEDAFSWNSFKLYRQLYILNTIQGNAFGQTFLPSIKLLAGVLSMMTMYASIKLGAYLHIMTYLFVLEATPALYVALFPITYAMSRMYNYSSKFGSEQLRAYLHASALKNKEKKLFRRYVWSCGIIRCRVGSLYYMEKDAKATLVQWLISGTTFLLLTYK